ncbi:MAG TPA: hypothetical protein VGH27_02605 [Streptosporangiaceae bacterium]
MAAQLAHLYLREGMSTYRIADITGLDRQHVTRILRQAGVAMRPRGAGGIRPTRRTGDPANLANVLAELYLRQRLSTAQIAAILDIPDRTIRDRLRRYRIAARTRGRWDREDRRTIPADVLAELYEQAGLTADEVGRMLGASRKSVLRNAHDLGIPVRTGGTIGDSKPGEIELVNALYADPLIQATLASYGIKRVPPGGPIWTRFPEPIPLTRHMVDDLYWQCGIGINHIELLTGQPAQTVRGFMRRTGITTRHAGGRTPFMRRWRRGPRPSPHGHVAE